MAMAFKSLRSVGAPRATTRMVRVCVCLCHHIMFLAVCILHQVCLCTYIKSCAYTYTQAPSPRMAPICKPSTTRNVRGASVITRAAVSFSEERERAT